MDTTSPIEIFATEDGSTEIQVRLQQDTMWLSLSQSITEPIAFIQGAVKAPDFEF